MEEIKRLTDEKLEDVNGGYRKPFHMNLKMYCPLCKEIHTGIERHPGKKVINGEDYQMYFCPEQNKLFATSGPHYFDLGLKGWDALANLRY